jgi:predicted DNA binding protein
LVKYLDLTLEQAERFRHPMEAFILESDDVGREELVSFNFSGSDDEEYLLFYVEGDVETYEGAIAGVDSVRDYQLTPIDADRFYAYVVQEEREPYTTFRRPFDERNLVLVPPVVWPCDGTIRMTVVGDGDDLRGLVEEIPDAVDVEIEQIGDYDRRHGTVAGGLTDRQYQAVQAAVDVGYYAEPRTGRLADVAEELDVATSTVSDHLRKAEARVMARLVGR